MISTSRTSDFQISGSAISSHKNIQYFAFTERFIPETGYAEETSLHFEIVNGQIVKEIKFRYRTSQKCACGTWNYR